MYNKGSRDLQDRFDSRRLADRIEQRLVRDHLTADDRAFVERLDLFFLATADADGQPTCSYKGGDPGFVKVVGPRELAFPCYDGNGMFLSMGNVGVNDKVGMLFIDMEHPRRLRVQGRARAVFDGPLLPVWPEAQLVVRVDVDAVFPNCPRYIHRYERVTSSPYVPREACETPAPAWKGADWAVDVLPRRRR